MLKHQLYPLIEKYIQEYLHGFTKKQFEIAISKGELKFQYLNLRPDTINKKMDEKNIPFWLKAGLIKKINIGCSVMNIIGEIPLELKIDGFDIIINPSYKIILQNLDFEEKYNKKLKFFGEFINLKMKSPIDIDFKSKTENFDKSIFEPIKELFKDKTIISNIINILYEKCYKFYFLKNVPMSIKIKNIHIRIEDDFFINYHDNIALGIRIDNIDIKLGKKGNMKKNSIQISKLDIYWENQAKILIPSNFLYSLYIDGQLQESYYSQLQDIKFQNFNYQRNTKFIIENFNSTINFGTKIVNNTKNIDIFNIKNKPCILYIQVSTNEININIWPELIEILYNFKQFTEKFKIIDKIKEYRPKQKPSNIRMKDTNYSINNDLDKNKIILIKNWIFYFLFYKKMQKYTVSKQANPLRVEFLRYFNIFCKRADITEKKEIREEKSDNIFNTNINNNNDLPIKIIQNDYNIKKNSMNLNEMQNGKNNKKNNFDFFSLGNKNNNNNIKNNNSIMNNKPVLNINSFLNEQKRKQLEENIKLKQINLVFITDILIKDINLNINPSLKKDNINYFKFKVNDIQIKLSLSKEKFDFNISTKNINFSPYNLVYGERELLSEESYRKFYQDPQINNTDDTLQNRIYPNYNNTEIININNMNNSYIYNGQINDNNKRRYINDELSLGEINNRRSRGSSYGSGNRNRYNNMENNNIIYKGINERPLNTIANNYYPNNNYNLNNSIQNININNNPQINNRYNSIIMPNNSFKNNFINNKIRLTMGRKGNNSFIENTEENPNIINKNNLSKKQRKEIDIGQAVNNYNTYVIKQRSITPISMIRPIKKRINNIKNIKEPFTNKNIPLNFLEIYSNTNNNSFALSFIKYNNPVSIDSFIVNLGTIRTNLFINYLQECLILFKDYNKYFKFENKINYFVNLMNNKKNLEMKRQLFNMKDYFYKKINRLPDNRKTESIIKYGEYLRKEIMLMKIFNSKVEDFQLNYLFSIFNNGIKVKFSFENIECVYYNKYKKMSGKFIAPKNEFKIIINLKKINIKVFGIELEINDLEDTKLIFKKIKKMFEGKIAMAEILFEPYYTILKKELDNKNEINLKEDIKNEEENDNLIFKNTNIKSNDETKNNINFINTNINSNNKIILDDNNILLNSFHKNIDEEENEKSIKYEKNNIININNYEEKNNKIFYYIALLFLF